jgi:transcriptional regulator with GAF, ATPase, and Fis domain
MAAAASAYLVTRREDGFGDVFPLTVGHRYTMGRAGTNRIVLKDDLCSREHAEVYHADKRWRVRDLNSLNGTRINADALESEWELSPGDEIHLGRTRLIFVDDMSQLPDMPTSPAPSESLAIKKRLGHTRFLTPIPDLTPPPVDGTPIQTTTPPEPTVSTRHTLSRDLALLYRLALDMGSAESYQDLVQIVLDGLLDAIPADTGAILSLNEAGDVEVTAHRHRDPNARTYVKVSNYVSSEVLATREAILAEDVARNLHLKQRESIRDLGTTSLICAPVTFGDKVLGLIHLYCTNPLKTLDTEDLEFTVAVAKHLGAATHQIQRQASLTAENRSLRDQLRVESELVGSGASLDSIESQIGRVAATNATVLIRGESGVGKELVARALHYSSPRREGPFVCLNCAALSETLLESELFGHEKGAFTGATEKKIGKFEAADHGTIFLDEIGEMSMGTQAKFLRVLEGHPFERVGGHVPIRVDVRTVAATNKPLEEALKAGTFRRDLFFRLQVVEIQVPPLRERKADIPILASHFLKRFSRETGRKVQGFTSAAIKKMESYDWPGNVRELRNVIERAVALGFGPILDADDIWLSSIEVSGPDSRSKSNDEGRADSRQQTYRPSNLEEMEKEHIRRTLEYTDWNKSQAAGILQIERSTLDRKIKSYEIKR